MFKSHGFVCLLLLVSVIYHATPSSASNIQERVIKVIVKQLGVDESEIKPESSLVDDLGADDLDVIELVMGIEEEFDIEIPDEEFEKIKTVQDYINYVNSVQK